MELFPYSNVRESQKDLIKYVQTALLNKKNLIVHAPTGLGKTAATLAPALEHAIENKLTIFFLTSRHTQHKIAIETIQEIKDKFNLNFVAVDIIGKKWMCPQPGTDTLYSNEFTEFCKKQIEDKTCEFYNKTKNNGKLTTNAKKVIEELKTISPSHTEKIYEICSEEKLCPYEISAALAAEASIIVADYYYIFHPSISSTFFNKIQKEPGECIVIVDEAHNLPQRIRDLQTERLSLFMLKRAIQEAKKNEYEEIIEPLAKIQEILEDLSKDLDVGQEKLISKKEFIDRIEQVREYEQLIADLEFVGDEVREEHKQSFIGSVGSFLSVWRGEDEGFARILEIKRGREQTAILSYRCLDPALTSKGVIANTYSTIAMSGTLTPTSMYKDLLGFEDVIEMEFPSPFPEENKLSFIVPEITTKYNLRNEKQFKRIAEICADITNEIPGNSAIFFPSYFLRDKVFNYYAMLGEKTVFKEDPLLTKAERFELLEKFKEYEKSGAVLLGTVAGSFGEGIDLPGDLLKGVVIVGLPLQQPNLETQELIKYYDKKFGKGWDYGYVFPAFNKALQSAGRCIRSETDRGVVAFLDNRYTWPNYKKCFPKDSQIRVSNSPRDLVKNFFNDA
ncbi:ATP-dependent DNA helicase [Nanoarchaeota archaeon]